MVSFLLYPPEPSRPTGRVELNRAGSNPQSARATPAFSYPPVFWANSGGLYPLLTKALTRPQPLDVLQTSAAFGRHDCLPL